MDLVVLADFLFERVEVELKGHVSNERGIVSGLVGKGGSGGPVFFVESCFEFSAEVSQLGADFIFFLLLHERGKGGNTARLARGFDSVGEGLEEELLVYGFRDKGVDTNGEYFQLHGRVVVSGDQEDGQVRTLFEDATAEGEAVSVGEVPIAEDGVDFF